MTTEPSSPDLPTAPSSDAAGDRTAEQRAEDARRRAKLLAETLKPRAPAKDAEAKNFHADQRRAIATRRAETRRQDADRKARALAERAKAAADRQEFNDAVDAGNALRRARRAAVVLFAVAMVVLAVVAWTRLA